MSVKVFSKKVLIGDTNFSLQLEMGPPFLRGHPNHVKVKPLAVQREYLHFSVILRPWVLVWPWESNLRPPALQSRALLTEPILLPLKQYTMLMYTSLWRLHLSAYFKMFRYSFFEGQRKWKYWQCFTSKDAIKFMGSRRYKWWALIWKT